MKPKISTKEFVGNEIRKWRKGKGLKSFELARIIGVSQGSMSDIETGKSFPAYTTWCSIHNKCKGFDTKKTMEGKKQ